MMIALIGNDGAGKSTQAKLLCEELKKKRLDVVVVSMWDFLSEEFPETGFIESERSVIRVSISEMRGSSRLLFLFWMMATVFEQVLDRHPDKIIIIDGFWQKHAAAELATGIKPDLITQLGTIFPKPDITVYLDIGPEVALARKREGNITPYECGRDPSLSENSFLKHQASVRAVLQNMAKDNDWPVILANCSFSSCTKQLVDIVKR